jgi:hypothetical protein
MKKMNFLGEEFGKMENILIIKKIKGIVYVKNHFFNCIIVKSFRGTKGIKGSFFISIRNRNEL